MPDQEEVDKFLPPYKPFATLHPDNVVSMGTLGMPEFYTEAQKAKNEAIVNSIDVIREVWKEWEKQFGRKYEPIQSYKTEDAEVALLTMGSMGETAENVAEKWKISREDQDAFALASHEKALRAQAAGDFAAIESHDLPIIRVHLGADPDAGLAALERALAAALDSTTEA